jgi:hypothetical protein
MISGDNRTPGGLKMTSLKKLLKIMVIGTSLVALTAISIAQDLEKPLDATISFSERKFDFGFMPKGAHVMHTFEIMNKGSDTLRIIKVSPTCGCTVTPLNKSDIAPDDTSRLDMFFDSKKFSGNVQKKTSILSNDPRDPMIDVHFVAMVDRVHPFLAAKPFVIDGGGFGVKVGSSQMVKLTNKGTDPLEVTIVSCSEPYMEARLSRNKIDPGKSVDLMLKIKQYYEAVGDPWYSVTLQTSDPQRYRLTIPVKIKSS